MLSKIKKINSSLLRFKNNLNKKLSIIIIPKIERFIYHVYLSPIARIKTLHHNLLQTRQDQLGQPNNLNVYQMFFGWILDTIEVGFVCSIPYTYWFGFPGWRYPLLVLGLGVIKDVIKYLRFAILGKE